LSPQLAGCKERAEEEKKRRFSLDEKKTTFVNIRFCSSYRRQVILSNLYCRILQSIQRNERFLLKRCHGAAGL
jgi:hypothetical protein